MSHLIKLMKEGVSDAPLETSKDAEAIAEELEVRHGERARETDGVSVRGSGRLAGASPSPSLPSFSPHTHIVSIFLPT